MIVHAQTVASSTMEHTDVVGAIEDRGARAFLLHLSLNERDVRANRCCVRCPHFLPNITDFKSSPTRVHAEESLELNPRTCDRPSDRRGL